MNENLERILVSSSKKFLKGEKRLMKNIKKVLIGTALAGSLVVGASYGTYSWFTAETSSTGTIENGTFALGEMAALFQHQNFAPSQVLFSEVQTIDNTGTLDQILKATYNHSVSPIGNKAIISKYKVGYFAFKSTADNQPSPDGENGYIDKNIDKIFKGSSNVVLSKAAAVVDQGLQVKEGLLSDQAAPNLAAKSQGLTEKTFVVGNGDNDSYWTLKSGEHIDVIFVVKLDESAGNEFQTIQYTGNFNVKAKQTDVGAEFK